MNLVAYKHEIPLTQAPSDILRRLEFLPDSLVSRTYLLYEGEHLVGMMSLDIIENEAELFEIYISRNYRKQGLGTKALREIDKLLLSMEMRSLWLFPQTTDDTPSDVLEDWYHKLGFIPVPDGADNVKLDGLIKFYL